MKSTGKFFLRTFIGAVVISVAPFLAGKGSIGIAALAFAIICTGGAGLIGVIPACYLVGLAVTIWWLPFGNDPTETIEQSPRTSDSPTLALAKYIRQCQKGGISDDTILLDCRTNGWTEDHIDQAFRFVKNYLRN